MKKMLFLALAATALVACQDKGGGAAPAGPAAEVATEEDFEDEAEGDIQTANISTELDKLMAEIDGK